MDDDIATTMDDDIAATQERTRQILAETERIAAEIEEGSDRIAAFMDANGCGEGRMEELLDMMGPAARSAMESANGRYMRATMAVEHEVEHELRHRMSGPPGAGRKRPRVPKLRI